MKQAPGPPSWPGGLVSSFDEEGLRSSGRAPRVSAATLQASARPRWRGPSRRAELVGFARGWAGGSGKGKPQGEKDRNLPVRSSSKRAAKSLAYKALRAR